MSQDNVEMSPAMRQYRSWEQRLVILRTRTKGHYSREEDPIVDAMTAAWESLTATEQEQLDNEGPRAPNRFSSAAPAAPGGEAFRWPSPNEIRADLAGARRVNPIMAYRRTAVDRGLELWSEPIIVDPVDAVEITCT